MAVTFLEVAEGLVYDEAEKAAFVKDPAGYLAARGLDGLDADDVADAVRFAVDNLPAPIARDIVHELDAPGEDGSHGLAALATAEPPLIELADPESLDGWGSPLDADKLEVESADDTGLDAEPADGDVGELPGDDILVEGFGQGSADHADSDPVDASPEYVGDDDWVTDGDAAPTWDLDASDVDTADALSAHDVGQPELVGPQPDAASDPSPSAEPGVDDGADPDGLGL